MLIEIIEHSFASPEILISLVLVVLLLLCSGFISGSETAIFSLSPSDIDIVKQRAKERARGAEAVLDLIAEREYTLATILMLNNMVNILITLLSTRIIDSTMEFSSAGAEFVFVSVIVTFLLLLFGEVLPKVFASHYSMNFAMAGAPVIRVMRKITKPLATVLVRSGNKVGELSESMRDNISLDELSEAIDITQTKSAEEKQMLSGVVNFADTEVESIMCPRVDVVALEESVDFDQVKRVFISSGFSRIPVYKSSLDEVCGVLYVKDVFSHLDEASDYKWTSLMRTPYFVTEHKKIADLLEEFRAKRVHMAIVVDEYGSTLGLVSLEDILEEVVGEISDESDIDEAQCYDKIAENVWLFDAKTHIGDMEKIVGVSEGLFEDVKGDAETLAGVMLEHKRRFLRKGDTLTLHGVVFTVTEAQARKVNKIKIDTTNAADN
ncbi:MAG: gliding motility-associated protein GldE [Rikenellaceae bacterium]|nr:gliding motility-associated protein GldE [Rikenellaceae bacterium]